jgi:hypothetical protein
MDLSGVVSASEAIEADICELPMPGDFSLGAKYSLPPISELLLTDHDTSGSAIYITRKILIEGNGAVLYFDDEVGVAIDVHADIYTSSSHQSPNWSSLKNFTLRNRTAAANPSIGIQVRAHGIRLDNLMVMGMGRGIYVHGVAGEANANAIRASNLVLTGHHSYAIYLQGSDANAGVLSGVETLNGTGIRDSSFLGNTWISPHSEANDKISVEHGSLVSMIFDGAANAATAVGGYIEAGDADPVVSSLASIFVGGNAIRLLPYGVDRVGYGHSRLVFRLNDPRSGEDYQTVIPGNGSSGGAGAINIQRKNDETWGWRLKIGTDKYWGWHSESPYVDPPFSWRSYADWVGSSGPDTGHGRIENMPGGQ